MTLFCPPPLGSLATAGPFFFPSFVCALSLLSGLTGGIQKGAAKKRRQHTESFRKCPRRKDPNPARDYVMAEITKEKRKKRGKLPCSNVHPNSQSAPTAPLGSGRADWGSLFFFSAKERKKGSRAIRRPRDKAAARKRKKMSKGNGATALTRQTQAEPPFFPQGRFLVRHVFFNRDPFWKQKKEKKKKRQRGKRRANCRRRVLKINRTHQWAHAFQSHKSRPTERRQKYIAAPTDKAKDLGHHHTPPQPASSFFGVVACPVNIANIETCCCFRKRREKDRRQRGETK